MGKKKNTEMIIILDVESETSDCSEEAPKTITRPTSLGLVEKFDKSPTGPPLCINCTIPQRKRSKMRGRKIYSSISPLCKPSRKIIDKKVPNRKQDQNSKTFPRLQPSKRIINSKIPVRKENQLDSNKFQFYLEDVLWSSFSAERKNSFAYLDCSWFPLYRKGLPKAKVLSWVRNRHIFSKKYVFVPLVCCLESTTTKPCMLLSDSLEIADPRRFEPDIRKFILDIYKVEGKPDHKKTIGKIPLLVPMVPQQRNKDDCGFFVLYFMELFMRCAPDNFSIDKGYPYFMDENWFSAESVQTFCEKVTFFCT
ncbi:probable ubiquitin-like-specific protease 2A isoform X2 [Papaver somniferum]|uniref:probable ubiquitin-like-specific protease 2A isoform X2 n=1 Tax=Papaver somniferum TaxID=3469 RepID=UPI000E705D9E|nr:probable ubiquitin-like-specific protease 2A isoform X2 [Papaver somniferum]